MKDLFIDTNVASRFTNPLDPEYKKLTSWLLEYDKDNPDNNAYLVVSKKLLGEYYASARNANSATSIPVIIDKLLREGRIVTISNEQIKKFQRLYFSKKIIRSLRSSNEDREHIPTVLLS